SANTRRRGTGVWIHDFGPVSSSPERRRQNVRTPTRPATRSAIALLLGRFASASIPGSACFALRFRTRFPTKRASQPTAAFRRLKTAMPPTYPRRRRWNPSRSVLQSTPVGNLGEAARPLRRRRFRLLWFGRVASAMGDAIVPVALTFAVLSIHGSATALGGVLASFTIARVV